MLGVFLLFILDLPIYPSQDIDIPSCLNSKLLHAVGRHIPLYLPLKSLTLFNAVFTVRDPVFHNFKPTILHPIYLCIMSKLL